MPWEVWGLLSIPGVFALDDHRSPNPFLETESFFDFRVQNHACVNRYMASRLSLDRRPSCASLTTASPGNRGSVIREF